MDRDRSERSRSIPFTKVVSRSFRTKDVGSLLLLSKLDDDFDFREVKLDVYGKRQTAKIKLLPSVFSALYRRIKIFVFAVDSKRHFSIFV